MSDLVELEPIKETTSDFEAIEKKILELFRREVYFPLLRDLRMPTKILNAVQSPTAQALNSGRITFSRGQFSGRFSAEISKELRSMGARWDRKTGTWRIPQSSLSPEIRNAVGVSEARFDEKIAGLDKKLRQIVPEEIADLLSVAKNFDATLWKTERDLKSTMKAIKVPPQLTEEQRKRVVDEWQNNMRLWIKDFTKKEIQNLRKEIQAAVFTGNRYGTMVKTIQKSYGVTQNKAKFLARQETSLLLAKYKETRYTAAGVNEYRWACVKMPHQRKNTPPNPGDVRYHHGILEGKTFSWNNPPIVNEKGERKNPGQDYNCRCFAIPIVRFK